MIFIAISPVLDILFMKWTVQSKTIRTLHYAHSQNERWNQGWTSHTGHMAASRQSTSATGTRRWRDFCPKTHSRATSCAWMRLRIAISTSTALSANHLMISEIFDLSLEFSFFNSFKSSSTLARTSSDWSSMLIEFSICWAWFWVMLKFWIMDGFRSVGRFLLVYNWGKKL